MCRTILAFCLLFASIACGEGFDLQLAEDVSVAVDNGVGCGSGVPIEIDGRYYIITADHVMYHRKDSPIHIFPSIEIPVSECVVKNNGRAYGCCENKRALRYGTD
jgi:hypothetical protein